MNAHLKREISADAAAGHVDKSVNGDDTRILPVEVLPQHEVFAKDAHELRTTLSDGATHEALIAQYLQKRRNFQTVTMNHGYIQDCHPSQFVALFLCRTAVRTRSRLRIQQDTYWGRKQCYDSLQKWHGMQLDAAVDQLVVCKDCVFSHVWACCSHFFFDPHIQHHQF